MILKELLSTEQPAQIAHMASAELDYLTAKINAGYSLLTSDKLMQ